MDQGILEAYKPLVIVPGGIYDSEKIEMMVKRFRAVAEKVQKENLNKLSDPALTKEMSPKMFKTKGLTDLNTLITVSVIGPIGLPMEEAMYPNVYFVRW